MTLLTLTALLLGQLAPTPKIWDHPVKPLALAFLDVVSQMPTYTVTLYASGGSVAHVWHHVKTIGFQGATTCITLDGGKQYWLAHGPVQVEQEP